MEILERILLRPLGRIHTVLLGTRNRKKAKLLEGIARATPLEVFSFAAITSIPNALVLSGASGWPAFIGMLLLTLVAIVLPGVAVASFLSPEKRKAGIVVSSLAHGSAPLVLLSWALVKYPAYYIAGLIVFWACSVVVSGRILRAGLGGDVKRNVRLAMLGNLVCAALLYWVSALIYANHY